MERKIKEDFKVFLRVLVLHLEEDTANLWSFSTDDRP